MNIRLHRWFPQWCKTIVREKKMSNSDIEMLAVSLRPLHLPRKFPHISHSGLYSFRSKSFSTPEHMNVCIRWTIRALTSFMQWSHCSRAWSEHGEWQSEEKITKCCHRLFYNAVSHYSRSVKGLVSFVKFGVPRIFLGLGMLAGYDSRYLVPQILYLHPSNHTFLWVGCEFSTWKMVLQYTTTFTLWAFVRWSSQ